MRKRDIKRLRLSRVILLVVAFALISPRLTTAGLYSDNGFDFHIPKTTELELHFSTLYEDAEPIYSDEACGNSYDEQLGYWFEDIPWLGIAAEAPLLEPDDQNQEISLDADTNFDPLSGFILLRYPNGQFQPFLGIGPTLFVSDLRNDAIDSLRHIFMGIYYSF